MTNEKISATSIRTQLEALGITRGDKIVMHSSLRPLGPARVIAKLPNCGADALVDGFLEAVGPDGLLCVPTFTCTFMNPHGGPSGLVFDPAATPSRVGSITNVVRQRPQAVRSLHPTHSWAAIGKDAAGFVAGHDRTSTFGRDSICGRMYDWDCKLVWFGTDGCTNTSTHFAEDWLELPYMTSQDALVKDGDGFKKVTTYRSPSGPRNFYHKQLERNKINQRINAWGIQKAGLVHAAEVKVMRHRDFMLNLLRTMIDDPLILLDDGRDDDPYHALFYRLNREHMDQLKRRKGGPAGIMRDLGCA
jgi:aminoglycoside 3-N-acetyltransferase